MADIREIARRFLTQVPATADVTSNGQPDLFSKLTGMDQIILEAAWRVEEGPKKARRDKGITDMSGLKTTTSCNGLTLKLGHEIGSRFSLGQFELEKQLKLAGMGDAWIPAKSGKRPQCGDVFRSVKYHIGASLEFVGDQWTTVESGQGGPKLYYDIVRRKYAKWDPSLLTGWVDIEILMQLMKRSPDWLKGWWRFETKLSRQFVYLPERGRAQAFDKAPLNFVAPPASPGTSGELLLDDKTQEVTITWPDSAEADTLRNLPNVGYMFGRRGPLELQAYRLKK